MTTSYRLGRASRRSGPTALRGFDETVGETLALGAAVREARARRGLSQDALGFAAGLHRHYIGAIERGEINPTFRTLLAVGVGLELKLSTLALLDERNMRERRWKLASTSTA
jgi:transcriptional regulator with XRE-family HTH domain